MRVPVPHNSSLPLVSIILFTPKGEVTTTVDDSHYWVDIPLPEGVQEEEVDVYSCFLGPDHRPPFGCGPALLRAATRKPVADVVPPEVTPEDPPTEPRRPAQTNGRRSRSTKHEVAQDERQLTERDAERT